MRRFLEKPKTDEISCNTINAGIYVLEPETFDRIPDDMPWSIERKYFPSLIERSEAFVAYIDDGYWLDIGTPDSYVQAHRDLMAQRCPAGPFAGQVPGLVYQASPGAVSPDASLAGPCYIGTGSVIEKGARVGPESVIGSGCTIGPGAVVVRSILWPGTVLEGESTVRDAVLGDGCRVAEHAHIGAGVILGRGSTVSAYSRIPGTV